MDMNMESNEFAFEIQNGVSNQRLPKALVVFEALLAMFAVGLTSYAGEMSEVAHASVYLLAIHVGICVLGLWIRTEFKMLSTQHEPKSTDSATGSRIRAVINLLLAITFVSALATLFQA